MLTGCEVYGFVSGIAGCVSIMSLAAVATDRYYLLCLIHKLFDYWNSNNFFILL